MKSSITDHRLRTLAVEQILLGTDERHPVTLHDIERKLRTFYRLSGSRKTIYQDLYAIERIHPNFRCHAQKGLYWMSDHDILSEDNGWKTFDASTNKTRKDDI